VSNFGTSAPIVPAPLPLDDPYFYQWGSFPDGGFNPSSANGFITVPALPPPPLNNATIVVPSGGWDTLSVRFDFPNYGNNGFTPGVIFEKVVPINVP